MEYNMNYLIAALIFLIFTLIHFSRGSRNNSALFNRTFLYFILLGLFDIIADIICSNLILTGGSELAWLTSLSLTVFYFMQVILPYSFYLYTVSLRDDSPLKVLVRKVWPAAIPLVFMLIFITANLWSHLLFFISQNGEYIHGPFYLAPYIHALFYVVLIGFDNVIHREEYSRKKLISIWEYVFIMGFCVLIQALWNQLLVTGFGLALGISILFFTTSNPNEGLDNFTGLFNLQYFQTWISRSIKRQKPFYILSIDLLQLKKSNKLFGSRMGDRLLLHIVEKLRGICPSGLIFRTKGSRLIIITLSLPEYKSVRDSVEELFQKPFTIDNEPFLFPAALCGITDVFSLQKNDLLLPYIDYLVSLLPSQSETTLIQGNDQTMRNFLYEREIEKFLPVAIQEDLFEVYYQPIYSLDKKKFASMEALSRLRHPTLGMLSPELFISIAERHGWIVQIGCLQFRHICRFVKEHPELIESLGSVKINLSPAELLKEGHCALLLDIIREYKLPCSFFQFEITETVATEYSDILLREIGTLLDAGISLNLDDFGTGYANLNTVLHLPFTCIKIDRSLLYHINEDRNTEKFYKNMVSLLKDMDYTILAEGVEYRRELNLISQWGVNLIQGFYYSRPLDENSLLKFLAEDHSL